MHQEVQKRLMEDLPAIPLFNAKTIDAARPNIAGFADRDPV
jgi:ABC-type transport system substrate-binding protein